MGFTYGFYFVYVVIIFVIGLFSLFLARKNYFFMIISLEILFIAINLNFAVSSIMMDDVFGMYSIIFILAISGAEIALGLALFILLYKKTGVSSAYTIQNTKG